MNLFLVQPPGMYTNWGETIIYFSNVKILFQFDDSQHIKYIVKNLVNCQEEVLE